MTASPSIALRPITADDTELLYRIYAGTRTEELAPVPWTQEQKDAFLEMQFRAQHADYQRNYPDAAYDVIECDGVAAGRLYVHRLPAEIRVIDIAMLPDFRGNGIGTQLLSELIREAGSAGKPLSIHVEKQNPAMRLYQRLGFVPIGDTGVYLLMERSPHATLSHP